jgi:hypothetical protein
MQARSRMLRPQPEGSDISKLVELFQRKRMSPRQKTKEIRRVCEFDGESQTLDLTRSNNVAISLKAFREFTNKSCERSSHFWTQREDWGIVSNSCVTSCHSDSEDYQGIRWKRRSTRPAETWFQEIADIKRIESKIVMRAMELFVSERRS